MTEESVRVLVKKRGGLKSAIVRINSAIVNFDKNRNTKHFLSVRLESLKSLSIKYDEVQSEIELIYRDIDTAQEDRVEAVSYTHLDVYKRQAGYGRSPCYAQLYFYDIDTAVNYRLHEHYNQTCNNNITCEISLELERCV